MNQVIHVQGLFVNLSPDAFHMWARHYYKCKQDFESPNSFSPVPYFLLCRAIELEVKSRHLLSKRQSEVKKEFGHDLLEAYEALDQGQKTLNAEEIRVLRVANDIYVGKGFEYFNPGHALRGYSQFPDLDELDSVATKLISR
ncbi:MAG: hypothetical protein HY508_15785 [Acidobacteria bacterium]|nr:hypothetical protein [Acidobacteriota bacterium]